MTNKAIVVAVLLHFRTPAETAACLRSLRSEGVMTTVLVDNSEDDGRSLRMLAPLLHDLECTGMGVITVDHGVNLGFAKGVNVGVRRAMEIGATAVILVNSDARIERGTLDMLVQAACRSGGAAAPTIVSTDGEPEPRLAYRPLLGCLSRGPGGLRFPSGACLLLSSNVARSFPLDESFFFYFEDVELTYRLQGSGIPLRRVDGRVTHVGSASSRNGSIFYEYHTVRGHWLLASRLNRTPARRWLALLLRGIVLPARAFVRSVRSGSIIPFRGLLLASWDVLTGTCRPLTPPAPASTGALFGESQAETKQ